MEKTDHAPLRSRLSSSTANWMPWLAAVVLAVGVAVAIVTFAGGGSSDDTAATPASGAGAPVVETKSPLSAAAQRVAKRFILTAVARRNLGEAYALAGPELLQGMSRAQWAKGEIAVVPYPVARDGVREMKVGYSYTDHALLEFLLVPRRGEDVKPQRFAMELRARGPAQAKRWLVVNWVPLGTPPTPRTG
jgi:hypothetical protein